MSSIHPTNLQQVIRNLNEAFDQERRGYKVVAIKEDTDPKQPVFLKIKYPDGSTLNIGIIHLVRLEGGNWDIIPVELIARTTDQIKQAIIDRIALFFDAKAKRHYINQAGTIFDFKDTKVEIHEDETFSIFGKKVTFHGKALSLTRISSEGVLEFRKMGNEDVQLYDSLDKRIGKGIFINTKGEVYRG